MVNDSNCSSKKMGVFDRFFKSYNKSLSTMSLIQTIDQEPEVSFISTGTLSNSIPTTPNKNIKNNMSDLKIEHINEMSLKFADLCRLESAEV